MLREVFIVDGETVVELFGLKQRLAVCTSIGDFPNIFSSVSVLEVAKPG